MWSRGGDCGVHKLIWMAILACLVGSGAKHASAGATVDLLFVGRNGSSIAPTDTVDAAPGDTRAMAVRFTNDVDLFGIGFSLNYDLDGANELDVTSAVQWVGVQLGTAGSILVLFAPLGPLGPPTSTFIGTFVGAVIQNPTVLRLSPGTYQIGTVTWTVNAGVSTDGADILSGFFNTGIDGLGGANLEDISATALFHHATVNAVIPEPGTALLLGLGLALLSSCRR